MQYERGRVGIVWKWMYAAVFAACVVGCGDDEREGASAGETSIPVIANPINFPGAIRLRAMIETSAGTTPTRVSGNANVRTRNWR